MNNKILKIVVTLVVTVAILINISCTDQSHRLKERKTALPIYLRVGSSYLSRNHKKEESSQSLHRLLLMLQKSLDSVQVHEMPTMELSVGLGEFSKI